MSNSPEVAPTSPEAPLDSKEMESINHEQRELLRDTIEKQETSVTEKMHESINSVKQEAINQATTAEQSRKEAERSPAQKRSGFITPQERQASFDKQMSAIQSDLSSSEQKFSKIIHNKTIEKLSDGVGNTIARPNALLAGAITAFICVTVLYTIAKHYGYPLSGFETIGAFILGWSFGLIYDYLRLMISGKK